ncbi:MAG: heavy metal translocating P-type ATPase [Isosphaeraceae bacterium]|nr:heavy metal translocating P-type ATPase [Isosphaeraceae bacterium]
MTTQPAGPVFCDHCQLPVPAPWWGRSRDAKVEGPHYCCFGCQVAAAISLERGDRGAARAALTRLGLAVFFTMNVVAFTMALWTTDVYGVDETSRLAVAFSGLFRYVALVFAAPVLLLLGGPLIENAVRELRRGVLSTDILLASGVVAAFLFSVVSVVRGHGPIYFEVGCVVLVMVTLGRWLEATGKQRATDALERLEKLLPEQVRRVRDGREELVPLGELARGDALRVLPGERIPADGRVVCNLAFVDEQVLTGESQPVLKQPGDVVLGGTLDLDGDLTLEVTAAGASGTLARLIEMVRAARQLKGAYERIADRVSSWFVPAVTAVALATLLAHTLTGGLERGLMAALAVVLISCPCALGLATPLAVWTALGRAAAGQVLFRSGDALERLASVQAVRFDKTGTLTTGTPRVAEFRATGDERETALALALGLASSSGHVLSRAIFEYADSPDQQETLSDVRTHAGLGVSGAVGITGTRVFLGSARFMTDAGLRLTPELVHSAETAGAQGQSLSFVGWDGSVRGLFLFDEQTRPSAVVAVSRLRGMALDLAILTGDQAARGKALAKQFGLRVEAGLLPAGKVAAVQEAREQFGAVAMVGDGINDAPALAASDVGVALGCGTDLSRDSALVCLLGDDLERLPWAIDLARRTVRVIRGNLAWAFGYNIVGVFCAAFGWLNPALAALLMVGSSALVIVNSLRLGAEGTGPADGVKGESALALASRPDVVSQRVMERAETPPSRRIIQEAMS